MKRIRITKPNGTLKHKSVGIVLKNDKGEIALLDRRKETLGWACPAGHIDAGEEPREAVKRELKEETGIAIDDRDFTLVLHVDVRNNLCRTAYAHEWSVYAGEADNDDIYLKEPHKHKGIGWFTPDEIKHLELEPVWRVILTKLNII